jgi:hypothetical protein
MVKEMVASDIQIFEKEKFLKDNGFVTKNPFE